MSGAVVDALPAQPARPPTTAPGCRAEAREGGGAARRRLPRLAPPPAGRADGESGKTRLLALALLDSPRPLHEREVGCAAAFWYRPSCNAAQLTLAATRCDLRGRALFRRVYVQLAQRLQGEGLSALWVATAATFGAGDSPEQAVYRRLGFCGPVRGGPARALQQGVGLAGPPDPRWQAVLWRESKDTAWFHAALAPQPPAGALPPQPVGAAGAALGQGGLGQGGLGDGLAAAEDRPQVAGAVSDAAGAGRSGPARPHSPEPREGDREAKRSRSDDQKQGEAAQPDAGARPPLQPAAPRRPDAPYFKGVGTMARHRSSAAARPPQGGEDGGPFRAFLSIDGRMMTWGPFATREEAARHWDSRARQLGKRLLNFPDESAGESRAAPGQKEAPPRASSSAHCRGAAALYSTG